MQDCLNPAGVRVMDGETRSVVHTGKAFQTRTNIKRQLLRLRQNQKLLANAWQTSGWLSFVGAIDPKEAKPQNPSKETNPSAIRAQALSIANTGRTQKLGITRQTMLVKPYHFSASLKRMI